MKYASTPNRLHSLVLGATGSGKSTRLLEIAIAEMRAGRGVAILDPHGDTAEAVLQNVPRRRKNDVVRIDVMAPHESPSLNPLRGVAVADRAFVTSQVLAAMANLAGSSWGFRTERILHACISAVLETRNPTLLDVERMMFDERFRLTVLRAVKDERTRAFFVQELPKYGGRFAGEAFAAPANKLNNLLAAPSIRAILTKSRPRFDARDALDRQRIVVASLPKGLCPDASILGSFLLLRLQQAALSRANVPPEDRKPFTVIVDELSEFLLPCVLYSLQAIRKFNVRLVLSQQAVSGLVPETRAALLANIGHLVVMRVMATDAELLALELDRYRGALTSLGVGERVERIAGQRAVLLGPRDPSLTWPVPPVPD